MTERPHIAERHYGWGFPAFRLAVLVLVAAVVIVPLFATVIGGFKELGELRTNPFGLPAVWKWQNYWGILDSWRYWRMLGNSLIIGSLSVALTLICGSMAAFVFAHLHFFGQRYLLNYILLGL